LNSQLPTTQYDIVDTVLVNAGGWVTERWGYHDIENDIQVTDGIDTFLIADGKIKVKSLTLEPNSKLIE